MKRLLQIFSAVLCLALAACASDLSSSNYTGEQVGVANKTLTGVVINKRVVQIDNNSHIGGAIGTLGGAVAGSAIGGGARANILGGLGGAAAGALLGNAIDKSMHAQKGYEYIIRVSKNNTVAVTQTLESNFAVGDHVMVIYGNPIRVIANNS